MSENEKKGCVDDCPCTKTDCERHAICCKCVANHKKNNNLPFCLRPPAEEEKKD